MTENYQSESVSLGDLLTIGSDESYMVKAPINRPRWQQTAAPQLTTKHNGEK